MKQTGEALHIGFEAKRAFKNFTGLGNYARTLLQNFAAYYPENELLLFTPSITKNIDTDFLFDEEKFKVITPVTSKSNFWRSYGMVKDWPDQHLDIFHGLSNELPFKTKRTSVKTVVTIHDLIFKKLKEQYHLSERLIYDLKAKNSCHDAHAIVAISEHTKKDIIELYGVAPEKIHVVYQTCNRIFFKEPDAQKLKDVRKKYDLPQEYILYVGTVNERKDLKTLLKAMRKMDVDNRPPLVIIGNGSSYLKKMKEYIQKHKLKKDIIWRPEVQSEDLPEVYHGAAVFIYPSYYEGFGIPVLEGILSKTPVITTDASSLPEAGGPFSYYYGPKKSNQLQEVLENVLNDTDNVAERVEKARKWAEHQFNDFKVTQDLMNVYEAVLME